MLSTLYLDHNLLTGNIPRELGNVGSLRSMSLRENRLSGVVLPELGALTRLYYLDLSRNELTGRFQQSCLDLHCLRRSTWITTS